MCVCVSACVISANVNVIAHICIHTYYILTFVPVGWFGDPKCSGSDFLKDISILSVKIKGQGALIIKQPVVGILVLLVSLSTIFQQHELAFSS